MRIERNPFVSSNTLAVALHGFDYSTSFGDMVLSPLTDDIGRRRSRRANVSRGLASRTFVRFGGINCAAGLRSFLAADVRLPQGGCLAFSPRFQLLDRARP